MDSGRERKTSPGAVARLIAARFISRASVRAAFFVGIWGKAAFELRASPGEIASLTVLMSLAALAGSLAVGPLIDRFGPRKVLVAGAGVFAPVALAPAAANSILELALAGATAEFCSMFVLASLGSFPPYVTQDASTLGRVNAGMETAANVAAAAGPAIGGALVAGWGLDVVFIYNALSSLVAAVLVVGVPVDAGLVNDAPKTRAVLEGLRLVYRIKRLRFCLLMGSLVMGTHGAFVVLQPVFVRDVLQTGPGFLGLINSVFGAGLFLGSSCVLLLLRRRVSEASVAWWAAGSGMAGMFFAVAWNLSVASLAALAWGFALGGILPLVRTLVHLYTPPGFYGRVVAVFYLHSGLGELLPFIAAPLLAAWAGPRMTLATIGALCALCALGAGLLSSPPRHDMMATSTPP